MADYYVWSGATGLGDGSSWANAFTSIHAALATQRTNADRVFVAHDHFALNGFNTTINGASSPGLQIICVNRAGSVPPTSADVTTGAIERANGDFSITFQKQGYVRGVEFQSGYNSSGSGGGMRVATEPSPGHHFVFERCKLYVASTNAGVRLGAGGNGASPSASVIQLINSDMRFRHASQCIALSGGAVLDWRGGSLDVTDAVPSFLIATGNGGGDHLVEAVDLSGLGSGHYLVSASGNGPHRIRFRNCRLGAGVAAITGSILADRTTRVDIDNCDSADSGMGGAVAARFERYRYQGTVVQETTIVRSSGAADPSGNAFSQRMTTNANASFVSPLEGVPMPFVYVGAVGSPVTATVEIVNDGVTLKDDEVWGEVQYLGTSGFPLSSFADDAKADVLATGANQSASTAAWTTTGLASPVKQKLEVTFTPQEKGVYVFTPKLARPSTTIYVDPLVSVV